MILNPNISETGALRRLNAANEHVSGRLWPHRSHRNTQFHRHAPESEKGPELEFGAQI
jgi:hypothetical protein